VSTITPVVPLHAHTLLRIAVPAVGFVLAACSGEKTSAYQGYVEGEYVHVASPVAGRLDRLLVQRGQSIAAKAPLFELESEQEAAAVRQSEEQLKAAQAQLADLKLGKRTPEVGVVQAQLAQAVAAQAQADQQLVRDEAQFLAGGIAQSQLEDSRANAAIKSARVRELSGQVDVSRMPAREEQVQAQAAQVEAARAAVSQAAWKLSQKRVASTQSGLVVDTLYREGEWVSAGSPIVRMLPPANVKVRFFVPESVVGGLKPGRAVSVHCDGCGADLALTVSYVANDPEFTPPIIYSNETRAKLVFLVEARASREGGARLRPGQPVAVTLK
jgi:HlyD family secretion protein